MGSGSENTRRKVVEDSDSSSDDDGAHRRRRGSSNIVISKRSLPTITSYSGPPPKRTVHPPQESIVRITRKEKPRVSLVRKKPPLPDEETLYEPAKKRIVSQTRAPVPVPK